MEQEAKNTYGERASHYLLRAKEASEQLDGIIPALEKFEADEIELEKVVSEDGHPKPSPHWNRLEYTQGLIEHTQSKLHLNYIKMLTLWSNIA